MYAHIERPLLPLGGEASDACHRRAFRILRQTVHILIFVIELIL